MRLTVGLLFSVTLLPALAVAIEPITTISAAGAAISTIGSYVYYNYLSCVKVECCNDPWVYDRPRLDFSSLYGQPLVEKEISKILKRRHLLQKPLALSFHGPTGTGKSFFSSMLSEMVFKRGLESDYVTYFTVGTNFPNPSKEAEYSEILTKTILRQLSKCDKSMFFFEEFEKVPTSVVAAVTPFLDHKGLVNGVSSKNATFVFISNTGSKAIVAKTYELWRSAKSRNDFEMHDFEDIIRLAVFNEKGAYRNSEIVSKALIDVFVPFLPLEKDHVRSCIETEFWRANKRKPTPNEVEKILADIRFSSDLDGLYAETGCKQVVASTWRYKD